ncbi:MAG: transcription antitermination factor NusB [Candidatus Paceibacterota bacterium]|jgi:N utilization substance protein B
MANRHLSRSIVLQSLFELDFRSQPLANLPHILEKNIEEFGPGLTDREFVDVLAQGVASKRSALDQLIVKAAPEWPLDKISMVDRNILRIGLYELLFSEKGEVPAKVAINESIELAKTFGGESSGRFVNGVLGTVYKEMGEPGKNEKPKKKEKKSRNKIQDYSPADLEKMNVEKIAGGVVYTVEDGEIYLALVHDIFGFWTLSKGHIDSGENDKDAVVRKIEEELGLHTVVEADLGHNEYIANDEHSGKVRRQVVYFLLKAPLRDELIHNSTGLDDARWFEVHEVVHLKIYDDLIPIITKAITLVAK